MIPPEQLWTGELNRRAVGEDANAPGGSVAERVGLYDTTLRDGEQTVGVALDPEQKLEIARAIDSLGIERIEAGFPRVSKDDTEAFRAIAGAGLNAEIWGFARAVPADVDALLEIGVRAAVIESPVSDGKLSAYGISREELVRRVVTAVSHAAESGVTVCFFGVDGSLAKVKALGARKHDLVTDEEFRELVDGRP
jgi:isopropylmalate/homocitrate/citramalate synthase